MLYTAVFPIPRLIVPLPRALSSVVRRAGFDYLEPPNYKHATQQRLCDYAVLAAGRRPRRLSIYLTKLTVHGGSELITG